MKIAIKGYIGTGKSTISKTFENKYDFLIIDADKIVKDLYDTNMDLKNKICEKFELEEFNKKKISSLVFNNKDNLKQLEAIVHPILEDEIKCQINKNDDNQNIIIDCQIIDKLDVDYDFEILAVASKEVIINRVSKRDGRTSEEIINILKTQEKIFKQNVKCYPINTELSMEEIEKNIEKIYKMYTNELKWKDEDEEDEEDW